MDVSSSFYRFTSTRGREFVLRYAHALRDDPTIEFRKREQDDRTLVEPVVPDMGFATVLYSAGAAPGGRRCVIFINGRSDHRARILWPGCARIGPLPIGEYRLTRWWLDTPAVEASDTIEITLETGHSVVRW
jgi:hypothetical protein